MPLQINNLIDGAADNVLGRSTLSGILGNPIYTSVLITIIIMSIVLYSYRNCGDSLEDSGTSFKMTALRTTFWVFIASMSIVFIHNRVLISEVNHIVGGNEIDTTFEDVTNPLNHNQHYDALEDLITQDSDTI
jgi:hypothetical protein